MLQISNYDIYIFDCDGVILDSNVLKIDAMYKALVTCGFKRNEVDLCVDYFKNNFGLSRFHHVKYFLTNFITVNKIDVEKVEVDILNHFSKQVKTLYLSAEITPGFVSFISSLNGDKYVASGSEQQELRDVFKQRGLDIHFKQIFGSPTSKSELIRRVVSLDSSMRYVMFGDAVSDFNACCDNKIDFIYYAPYSNVKNKMKSLADENGFIMLDSWPVINNTL